MDRARIKRETDEMLARMQHPPRLGERWIDNEWMFRGVVAVAFLAGGLLVALFVWIMLVQIPAEVDACQAHGWSYYSIYKSAVCADQEGVLHAMPHG